MRSGLPHDLLPACPQLLAHSRAVGCIRSSRLPNLEGRLMIFLSSPIDSIPETQCHNFGCRPRPHCGRCLGTVVKAHRPRWAIHRRRRYRVVQICISFSCLLSQTTPFMPPPAIFVARWRSLILILTRGNTKIPCKRFWHFLRRPERTFRMRGKSLPCFVVSIKLLFVVSGFL